MYYLPSTFRKWPNSQTKLFLANSFQKCLMATLTFNAETWINENVWNSSKKSCELRVVGNFFFRKKVTFMVEGISWLNNWMLSINSPKMSSFKIELSVGSGKKVKNSFKLLFLEIFDWLRSFVDSLIIMLSFVFEWIAVEIYFQK